MFLLFRVLFVAYLSFALPAFAEEKRASNVIVSVNGLDITSDEIERLLPPNLHEKSPSDPAVISVKSEILSILVRDRIAQSLVTDDFLEKNPRVVVDYVKRRSDVMLETYASSQFYPHFPIDKEIDAFVNDHPEFFKNRKTYHFYDIQVKRPTDENAPTFESQLIAIRENPSDVHAVEEFNSWMNRRKIDHNFSNQWRSTEQIEDDTRAKLRQIESNGVKVSVYEKDDNVRVLAIADVFADPLDPAPLRKTIAFNLFRSERDRQTRSIVDKVVAAADIKIFDTTIPLNRSVLPVANAEPVAPPAFSIGRVFRHIRSVWFFSLFPTGLVAIYIFIRRRRSTTSKLYNPSIWREVSYSGTFKAIAAFAVAVLFWGPVAVELQQNSSETLTFLDVILPILGITIGLVLVVLAFQVPSLRYRLQRRWAPFSALVIGQMIFGFVSLMIR